MLASRLTTLAQQITLTTTLPFPVLLFPNVEALVYDLVGHDLDYGDVDGGVFQSTVRNPVYLTYDPAGNL